MLKRILFISDHGDPLTPLGSEQAGGQNNYVKQLAQSLGRRGYYVDVLTHWTNPKDPEVEKFGSNCRVIRIAAGNKTYIAKNKMFHILPLFYQELHGKINIANYDVIHTHYWLSGILGMFIQKDFTIPWVHTNHSLGIAKQEATGIEDKTRLTAEKIILQSADRIVATTNNEKKVIQNFAETPSPIEVLAIGVDPIFQPKRQSAASDPYFAFAGRLEKTKGLYTMIDAFRKMVNSASIPSSAKLLIAGGDMEQVDINNKMPLIRSLRDAVEGHEDRIHFLGPQNTHGLAKLFNGAVSTIVPSYYESFGMVAAEAQACGCPVIASIVGGLKDVVINGYSGVHVAKKDADQLSMAMHTMLNETQLRKKLGRNAVLHAKESFNWSRIAKDIYELYEVVIDEKQNTYAGDRLGRYISRR